MQARARAGSDPGHRRMRSTLRYRSAARSRSSARRASGLRAWKPFSVLSWVSPERSSHDARTRALMFKQRNRGLKSRLCRRPFKRDMSLKLSDTPEGYDFDIF